MKKKLCAIVSLSLILSLSACQKTPAESTPAAENTAPIQTQSPQEDWHSSYDVVVIGSGGAGLSAAIEAADAGASVLVLEKAPESAAGGNTRLSGQQILSPTDVDTALDYFDTIFEGYAYDKDLVRTTVQGMHDIADWLMDIGGPDLDLQEIVYPEFPAVAGSDTMRCYLIDGERSTAKGWNLLKSAVDERSANIALWYDSPALELIQDPETKTILGVLASHEGQEIKLQAKNGVVMACGGYENNQEMIQNYFHMEYAYPKGTYYNTGDGVVMAMKVGADLWHMNNPAGPDLNFKAPDNNAYYGYSLAMDFGSRSTIYVGPDGTRFLNESLMTKHGKMPAHGAWQTAATVLPAYAVFDEASFTAGPITSGGGWSKDNLTELEKGWIVKADTLEELAALIGVDAAGLEKTVDRYAFYCEEGEDYEFGRDPKTLIPLSKTGPYYAMELTPTLTNTQGGAVRNANCEVVDLNGYAIPHLYSAGEFGSMFVHGYNGGGNVSEALVTGRIAGANAAQSDKSKIPTISTGKAAPSIGNEVKAGLDVSSLTLADGVYTGVGQGMASQISVEITLSGGRLDKVEVLSANDTAGISDKAIEQLPSRILDAQSTGVDVVAGATMTSDGILAAVEDALTQAAQ